MNLLALIPTLLVSMFSLCYAHRGVPYYSIPIDNIKIDGDLSDWPEDMRVYRKEASDDFSAEFMVGHSLEEQLVYVAVRVEDDEIVVNSQDMSNTDACIIDLNALHGINSAYAHGISYIRYPGAGDDLPGGRGYVLGHGATLDIDVEKSRLQSAISDVDGIITYEWALPVLGYYAAQPFKLENGTTLGFGVIVGDQDPETRDALYWPDDRYPIGHPQAAGVLSDLVLMERYGQLGSITGVVIDREGGAASVPSGWGYYFSVDRQWEKTWIKSSFDADDKRQIWVQHKTGFSLEVEEDGSYQFEVAPGSYRLSLSDAATGRPIEVTVQPGGDYQYAESRSTPNRWRRWPYRDRTYEGWRWPFRIDEKETGKELSWDWKFHPGDEMKWAEPGFDDSAWPVANPLLWERDLVRSGWNGIGWFRLDIAVSPELWSVPLALSCYQNGAAEIYLDGKLVQRTGKISGSEHGEGIQPTENPIPTIIAFSGRVDHVIAVRYSNFANSSMLHTFERFNGFGLEIEDANRSVSENVEERLAVADYVSRLTLMKVFAGIPLTFSILHFFLFSFYIRAKENLYYSVFTFAITAMVIFYYQNEISLAESKPTIMMEFVLGVNIGRLFGGSVLLMMFPIVFFTGLRFLYAIFYPELPRQFWFLLLAYGVALIVMVVTEYGIGYFLFLFSLLALFELFRVIAVAVKNKRDGAWLIGGGIMAFLIVAPLFEILYGVIALLFANSLYLARNVGRTNEDLEIQLTENEELSEQNLAQERALRERMAQELEEARQLQLSMLPQSVPELPSLDIAWRMETATEVGGDYYDYSLADDGTLTLTLGDATGHGMQAGTVVTATKSLFQSHADQPSIVETFRAMTRSLKGMNLQRLGMAMAMIKLKDRRLQIASAGIPPALVYRAATGEIEEIEIGGIPLGYSANSQYEQRELELDSGDALVLMSDGLPERLNARDEDFGYPRTQAAFKAVAARTPAEICQHLAASGDEWADGRLQDDDVTFVALKMK